jgi:hypothetical protein
MWWWGAWLGPVVLLLPAACVERTARIRTDPAGALVTVNDEEVGVSPVKFSFLWYGDYDILIRKTGYQTLRVHHNVSPPWYEWPPIDLVSEVLVPKMLKDEHVLPTYALEPAEEPTVADVVRRAEETRDEALSGSP